jgi:hypothetical protein
VTAAATTLTVTLSVVFSLATTSPARACKPSGPDARVHVSFLADSDLATLAKWGTESICIEYTFNRSLAERRLAQGVILTVTGRDVGTIFEILLHTMNLRSTGRGAKRAIVAAGPETTQSKTANEREKADGERDKVLANIDAEITRKDDSHYRITRRGANAIIASISSIARSVRVQPEAKNGKPIGFRLLSLKPGSVPTRFGFQNGDLVSAFNGNDLTAPDKALDAYAKFRTTGVAQVSFIRQGKTHTVELKIE